MAYLSYMDIKNAIDSERNRIIDILEGMKIDHEAIDPVYQIRNTCLREAIKVIKETK